MTTPLTSREAVDQDQLIRDLLAAGRRQAYLREVDALTSGSRGEKREAAQALLQYGEAALEPLCGALADPDDRIKVAAARALAELGDPRAIPALAAALREGLSGGTARSHLVTAGKTVIRAFAVGVVVVAVAGLVGIPAFAGGVLSLPFIYTLNWFTERRERSVVHQVLTETIVSLGEAAPTPQLRELLPDLRILAADRLQQEPEARRAFTLAANRIDLLTRDLRVLPIAAAGAVSNADALPRSAEAPDVGTENLPVAESGIRSRGASD